MSARSGTPIDGLLDALEERMGIEHVTAADDAPSQRARVVWARAGAIEPRSITYRVPGERTRGRNAHPWTATIFGPSDLEVTGLLHQLQVHIDDLLGPPQGAAERETLQADVPAPLGRGYELKAGKIEPRGGNGTATQYACDVAITIFTRIRTRIRGTVEGAPALLVTPLDPDSLATPTDIAWPA